MHLKEEMNYCKLFVNIFSNFLAVKPFLAKYQYLAKKPLQISQKYFWPKSLSGQEAISCEKTISGQKAIVTKTLKSTQFHMAQT